MDTPYNASMSRRSILILIGIWSMAFLFIGFPALWDKVFSVVVGAVVLVIGLKDRPMRKVADTMPYVEHKNGAHAMSVDGITGGSSPRVS